MRRRALVVTALSLAAWLAYNQFRVFRHPWGDLSAGCYTDHLSHMNAARAFPRVGLDIWRKPALELSRPATPEERAAWPDDVHPGGTWKGGTYAMDGWPVTKPWVTSWPHKPRLYPPGDMLLVAPVALVYHFTGLSLTEANRWLFSLFLVYAHAALFLVLENALGAWRRYSPLLVLATGAIYVFVLLWTLQGFYDPAAIVPLLLCARYLEQRRGLAAGVAYAVAAFLHFRAFFLAPWALYAAWIFVKGRQWRGLRPRDYAAMGVGAACAGASLTAFALVSPTLARQDVNNSLNLSVPSVDGGALVLFAVVVAFAAGMMARARAWLDLAVLAWLALMMLFVKEAHAWHVVIPLAWLAAPVSLAREGSGEVVRAGRLAVLAFLVIRVMVH